jgi:Uma2 family endonuclease
VGQGSLGLGAGLRRRISKTLLFNISDYWVIDLKDRQVHIFRDPMPTGYASHLIIAESQTVSPLAFPEIAIPITTILSPI